MVLLKCDLHVHTNASRDGESSVEDVLAAAVKAGLDAIAITDHDTTEGSLCALAVQNPGVLIIPGIEVSTRQAKALGAVTIVPHPFHRWRHGVGLRCKDALREADAVEALNSRYIIGTANQKAAKMAKKYGRPVTAGSDAHNCKFVGFGITEIDAEARWDASPAPAKRRRSGRTHGSHGTTRFAKYADAYRSSATGRGGVWFTGKNEDRICCRI